MGDSETTVGEGGAIRLPLEEALVRQAGLHGLGHEGGGELQVDQGILLKGAQHAAHRTAAAAQGEEPVGKVHGTKATGPVEHAVSDDLTAIQVSLGSQAF